jgi:lipid-A-disaccharide synthase-like uncharacterized protein
MLASFLARIPWTSGTLWLAIGFLGQTLFGSRFVVQWLASEKAKHSVVPVSFWYLSLAGGLVLLAYAIYQRDPVFIAGQSTGALIYIRNLALIRRGRKMTDAVAA